ncbi:MAG: DUF1836 domain-containing protein [Clostridia bacterium]|nr:DUF1836 domain-containing protein [Clostridia bacterium]
MYIEKDKFAKVFSKMTDEASHPSLPMWNELPDLELYMDQVISIISKYFKTSAEEKNLTPSMVNNYVKLGIIPAPIRKKYSREHLAYLLMVCTLKQTLDMATIQKIVPVGLDSKQIEYIYNSFVKNQSKAYGYVTENVLSVALPIFENEGENQDRLNDLLLQVASAANIFKLLTEKLTDCNLSESK